MEYGNLQVYFQPRTHKMAAADENIAESTERQKDVESVERLEKVESVERLEEKLISNNIFRLNFRYLYNLEFIFFVFTSSS